MSVDYVKAATKALETILKNNVSTAPVSVSAILDQMAPAVLVTTFSDLAIRCGRERNDILKDFNCSSDAFTSAKYVNGRMCYTVTYNRDVHISMLRISLARELGHIVLEHDGSRPEPVRMEQARCFARHLLCPRPLLVAAKEAGIQLTTSAICDMIGCSERFIGELKKTPPIHVPANLNREAKAQFATYVQTLVDRIPQADADASPADLGAYLDEYED